MENWRDTKKNAVTFSYDDGVTQDIHLIELLNKYGLKCTFNINSGLLGYDGMLVRHGGVRVSHYKIHESRLAEVYKGHEVAVHTLTHPQLNTCSDEEIVRQVEEDRKKLSSLVGYNVVGMAYPCGSSATDARVDRIVKENTGVLYSRGTDCSGNFDEPTDMFDFKPSVYHLDFDKMFEHGRKFIELETDKPQIFYIWGHSYELDYESDYWYRIEEFFKLISGKDDIFYGNNTEVLIK
jgi:peptidoglycan/xylan/chitin deacetylase (PgdA/CDA1 family)